jgi:hypothetical protein
MHLSPRAIALWAVIAVAVAVGAFLVGEGSGSEPSGQSAPAATGPQPIAVPQLGDVAALPAMRHPMRPARQVNESTESTEEPTTETEESYESYEPTVEEGPVESSGESSSGASEGSSEPVETPSTTSEPTHTETPSTGASEELVPEG